MDTLPVYEITAGGKEIAHIGWAKNMVNTLRIASAYGHSRVDFRDGYEGSLGAGYGVVPKKPNVEV